MSHNTEYEKMPVWVIWAGVGMMIFTVLVFVLFTIGVIYWG
jgi:hypothetical protein